MDPAIDLRLKLAKARRFPHETYYGGGSRHHIYRVLDHRSSFCPKHSQLATQYSIHGRGAGDVQQCGIQMYPGPYFTGRVGVAQGAGVVAAGQWSTPTESDTNSRANSYAHAEPHAHT